MKNADFIDVMFKLSNECYSPYKKPSHDILYVSRPSNYLQEMIKMLPSLINERFSKNSYNETIFKNSNLIFVIRIKRIRRETATVHTKTWNEPKRYENSQNELRSGEKTWKQPKQPKKKVAKRSKVTQNFKIEKISKMERFVIIVTAPSWMLQQP